MSAELMIHIFEGISEKDLERFFSNTFGSKWFNPRPMNKDWDQVFGKIAETDSIVVGDVSWLKAAITEDGESYIPGAVSKICELIGEDLPVIDDVLIQKISEAFGESNKSGYAVGKKDRIVQWLTERKGKKVFTVSW